MNEIPSSSEPAVPSVPVPASGMSPSAAAPRDRSARRVFTIALGVIALLLAVEWWATQSQLSAMRGEVAQRLQAGDSVNNETKMLTKSAQEGIKELQAKINVLENKQAETQSQQVALDQLYQELSRSRDDWALAEVEQVLSTASQQLQLAGNVQGALIALQNADRNLSRSDKPQFIQIRRAIAHDLDRLKSLPQVDVVGIAVRLDSAIRLIDTMPLLSDEKPAVPVTPPKNARIVSKAGDAKSGAGKAGRSAEWIAGMQDKWDSWSNEMWGEIKQLIRVREVDTPGALLLSPTQAYYARENLKLRLLNARLGLLSRNEPTFRSDLLAAQDAISKYFDANAKQTQTVQALLKQAQNNNLSIQMPTLADSLNAVRNYSKAR